MSKGFDKLVIDTFTSIIGEDNIIVEDGYITTKEDLNES